MCLADLWSAASMRLNRARLLFDKNPDDLLIA
jgi:hypothetical protein